MQFLVQRSLTDIPTGVSGAGPAGFAAGRRQEAKGSYPLNPEPPTLHPKLQTLHTNGRRQEAKGSHTLNPKPQTLDPKPQTLHTQYWTLNR